jgi:dynamin 1-like protein
MVTKRPLVLQLITSQGQGKLTNNENVDETISFFFDLEYAVFGHKPQQRFINYADVRAEIENDTKAVVREDMGVSNLPINLTIYSPHGNKIESIFKIN